MANDLIDALTPELTNIIAKAIKGAENNPRNHGVLSVSTSDPSKVLLNSIKNNWDRWATGENPAGWIKRWQPHPDGTPFNPTKFIDFMHRRWAPIGAENDPEGLNKNWANNVRKLIEKQVPKDFYNKLKELNIVLNPFNTTNAYAEEENMPGLVESLMQPQSPVDLGTIEIIKNLIGRGVNTGIVSGNSSLPPPMPISPLPQQPLQSGMDTSALRQQFLQSKVAPKPQLDENGQTSFGRFLSQMGIPLAAAATGLAFPKALPAASGFQTGYTSELQRQKDFDLELKKMGLAEKKFNLEEEKNRVQQELNKTQSAALLKILSDSAGIPPGTTARVGSLNVPLNRVLTTDERNIVSDTPRIVESIDAIISLLDAGAGKSNMKRLLIDTGKPFLVSGQDESMQSALNDLKSTIPFMKGGKNLTGTERDLILRLLDTFGKDDKTIKKDLTRFKNTMISLDQLVSMGEQYASNGNPMKPEIFNALKSQILGFKDKDIIKQSEFSNEPYNTLDQEYEQLKKITGME